MNRMEAHALLDAARGGVNVPERVITHALHITGDLTDYRPAPQNIADWLPSDVGMSCNAACGETA